MSIRKSWLYILLILLLAGCAVDENNDTDTAGSDPRLTDGGTETVFAQFDAASLPMPNDVTWAKDGNPEVDLPLDGDGSEMDQLKALINAQEGLLGLSPNMFLTLPLTDTVNSATLDLIAFRIDDPALLGDLFAAGAAFNSVDISAALQALDYRTDANFVIDDDFDSGVIKLLPKTPFTPAAGYAVVVGPGLKDSNGYDVVSSFTMQALKSTESFAADSPYASFERLRAGFNDGDSALFDVVEGVTNITSSGAAPWTRSDVLVMWTFNTAASTLSLTPAVSGSDTVDYPDGATDPFAVATATYKGASALFTSNNLIWLDLTSDSPVLSPTPVGLSASDVLAPQGIPYNSLGNIYFGVYNSPVLNTGFTTSDSVPFLLAVPSTVAPAGGYPLAIFQHGITRSKEDAFALANSLAGVGIATLAIDAPLHGDRTVDGGESGDGFFTTNLIANRAALYQSAVDLWEAVDVLTDIDTGLTGSALDGIDATNVDFVSHSLGSIIGSVFLSQETRVGKMILSSPSAMLVNVLDETALPDLQALVTSLGYLPGTTEYYVFLNLAQWLLDPTDGAYNGIGANSTGDLINVFAYDDPVVPTTSSRVFMSNIGLSLNSVVTVVPGSGTTAAAGSYEFGQSGTPIVHSFLLSPLFNSVDEPWYSGYDLPTQISATTDAQIQAATYLFQP